MVTSEPVNRKLQQEIKVKKALLNGSADIFDIDAEELILNAYYGTGGFADGTYLVPHKRERLEKYKMRRNISYYLNYMAPISNGLVDPIFRKEAQRDWKGNDLFGEFVNDVDMNGSTMSDFIKQAALMSKLLGVCFIAMDNFPEQPTNLADVIEQRAFPYAYLLEPSRVKKWKLNRFGQLTSITYSIPPDEIEQSDTDSGIKMNTITWTSNTWEIRSAADKVLNSGEHSLGRIPVIPLFSRKVKPGDVKPISEMYSIARVCVRIFNLCSEVDEILRNQAFSILTYPGGSNNKNNDITVGVENVLGYSQDSSHSPAYIAPPSDPAKILMEQIDRLIEECYRMANLAHTTGVEKQTSGVAKQYDFQKANQSLADLAANCAKVERDMADIFQKWTGTKFDYAVDYGDDFGIEDVMSEIDKAIAALELTVGGEFDKEVKLQVARIYFASLDEGRLKEILDDIEAQHEDQMQTEITDQNISQQSKEIDLAMKKAQAKMQAKGTLPPVNGGGGNGGQ